MNSFCLGVGMAKCGGTIDNGRTPLWHASSEEDSKRLSGSLQVAEIWETSRTRPKLCVLERLDELAAELFAFTVALCNDPSSTQASL